MSAVFSLASEGFSVVVFVPSPPKYQNSRPLGPRKGSSSQIVGLCWGAGRAESGS